MAIANRKHIRSLCLIATAACFFTANASAAEFCALSIRIITPEGRPARLTPVKLLDPSGKVIFDEQVETSEVQICDFGFGAHTLVVGYRYCHPVSISGLVLHLDEPLRLTVQLNQCSNDVWRDGCLVYLRIRDPSGSPVENATLVSSSVVPSSSDRFGRVTGNILKGNSSVVLKKAGYVELRIPLACPASEEIDKEIIFERTQP
jgi:hypothetical protein